MIAILSTVISILAFRFRRRASLELELIALRHQVSVLRRQIDRYLVRDAQRVIEAIEALVRIHTAQEEDIYDAVVAR